MHERDRLCRLLGDRCSRLGAASRNGLHGKNKRWVLHDVLKEAWIRFIQGWRALPENRTRRFCRVLAVSFIGLLLLIAALVLLARNLDHSGALAWEREFLAWIARRPGLSFAGGVWMQTPGNSLVTYPLVAFGTIVFALARRPLLALGLFLGFVLLKLAILFGWLLWPRDRPDFILGGAGYSPSLLGSYPSGHVAGALFVFGWFVLVWIARSTRWTERLTAFLVLAATVSLVSLGRLRVGAHWPTDILSAWLVSSAWLVCVGLAVGPRQAPSGEWLD